MDSRLLPGGNICTFSPVSESLNGIVVASSGRLFRVQSDDGRVWRCEMRKRIKDEAESETPVAVGDDVALTVTHDDFAVIESVAPRRSAFFRPTVGREDIKQVIAANLDRLAIVASVVSPPLKTGLIDRFLVAADLGALDPVIIINKVDLATTEPLHSILDTYESLGFSTVATSIISGSGLDELRQELAGHRTLFVGHSGVGKSSLLNRLLGLTIKTREVSDWSNRGKHTTTTIEMYAIPSGGHLVDSPGLKVLGLWDLEAADLEFHYPEFTDPRSQCRFQPCSHIHEPKCGVKAAVADGKIADWRYDGYVQIYRSLSDSDVGADPPNRSHRGR